MLERKTLSYKVINLHYVTLHHSPATDQLCLNAYEYTNSQLFLVSCSRKIDYEIILCFDKMTFLYFFIFNFFFFRI